MYDYLVVGAGITGSVIARLFADAGLKVKVIDKRDHIGGNCYTDTYEGLPYCKYGGHIFHTSNKEVWDFVNKYGEWNQYQHKIVVSYVNRLFSFPINLMTFYQLWRIDTPDEARRKIEKVRHKIANPINFEEKALSMVGSEIYYTFLYGYTKKQWNMEPRDLPASLLSRVPIRYSFDDNYYNDKYQAIPTHGYTRMFENLLDGVDLELGVEFKNEPYWFKNHKKIIFTGPIDEYYGHHLGRLGYRSLRFEWMPGVDTGAATVNFTDADVPYTRIVSFNNFYRTDAVKLSMKEFPESEGEPFYPIDTEPNRVLYKQYKSLADPRVVFCGRLGTYKYIDMDQAIGMALLVVKRELTNEPI